MLMHMLAATPAIAGTYILLKDTHSLGSAATLGKSMFYTTCFFTTVVLSTTMT